MTSVGGGPCTGPRRPRHRKSNGSNKKNEPWHESLFSNDVKETIHAKSIRTKSSTIDISLDENRIKLGTGGYASLAREDGILAEGSFVAQEDGSIDFTWERVLQWDGDEWTTHKTDELVSSLSLMNGMYNVKVKVCLLSL